MMAVVQAQDAEVAKEALVKMGVTVERLPSVGGFLGRRNATLVIGMYEPQRERSRLNRSSRNIETDRNNFV